MHVTEKKFFFGGGRRRSLLTKRIPIKFSHVAGAAIQACILVAIFFTETYI